MEFGLQQIIAPFARFSGPIRTGIEIVLIVCVSILVARIVWLVAAAPQSVATHLDRPLPSPIQEAASGRTLSTDRTLLIRENPFEQGAIEEVFEAAPETTLNLRLNGLRMSGEGGISGNAIVQTPDGIGKNYRVGDEIIPGVTLQRILSDRVVISRDGVSETLMLGGRGAGLSVISDDSQTIQPNQQNLGSAGASAASSSPGVATIDSPERLFASIRASAVQQNGRVLGYRLSPNGDGAAMQEAGLEPGDVLVRVDGAPVGDLDFEEILSRLIDVNSVILQVERDGSERAIRLEFREVG